MDKFTLLAGAFHCNFVWAGDIDRETNFLIPFAASALSTFTDSSIQKHLTGIIVEQFSSDLTSFTKPLYTHFATEKSGKNKSANYNPFNCNEMEDSYGNLIQNMELSPTRE